MRGRNLFWGVFFILAGALIIVNQLGYFTGVSLISLVITIFLVAIMIKSISYWNFSGILFPLAIMGILYAKPLGIESLTPWPILGVALFSSIGLSFLFPHHHRYNHTCTKARGVKEQEEGFTEIIDEPDGSIVDFRVRFGAGAKYINTENFKQANLDCSFGAMKVYFDDAKLIEQSGIIQLDASFSGVELYIPKEWQIVNHVDVVLGAIEEKNKNTQSGDKKVTLTGRSSFSGIEIIYG